MKGSGRVQDRRQETMSYCIPPAPVLNGGKAREGRRKGVKRGGGVSTDQTDISTHLLSKTKKTVFSNKVKAVFIEL